MNDNDIINEIKKFKIKSLKSVVTSNNKGGYTTSVMKSYHGGSGLGSMGSVSLLDIDFKKKESAERLHQLIKKKFR